MVKDPDTVWLGVEYFCNTNDELWNDTDESLSARAVDELRSIGLIEAEDVLDSVVIKTEKAYPSYYGTYISFHEVRNFLDEFHNLFPIGRNGMHKYNNSDHSMLTAMTAVENIINEIDDKSNIWEINTEEDFHEEK